ncbi:TetR/AcrR family transcriptional regulator [Nonomuraea glycinis]|uniref:TetR/AcrR family transcriptional regulator n=1 Tax=Nonomuraea glycinis TaxID=2047744 RepID=UPI002E114DA9|nr:TetR/AcrR family transcriptional regulator [Nonomuraea glycinis]
MWRRAMVKAGRPPQDPARQLARAHQILDAAAELILRWGYDKTTVDDVATQADVAKGTIYLHWKTRDALFAALLRRERVLMLEEVRAAAPGTLREVLRGLAGALLRRPLMRALLLGDNEVLGRLGRQKRESVTTPVLTSAFETYLGALAELGVVRADRTPAEQLVVVSSVLYGFLVTQGLLPESARVPDDRLPELIADTADRALSADPPANGVAADAVPGGSAGRADAVAGATRVYLDTVEDVARRKLALSLGVEESAT